MNYKNSGKKSPIKQTSLAGQESSEKNHYEQMKNRMRKKYRRMSAILIAILVVSVMLLIVQPWFQRNADTQEAAMKGDTIIDPTTEKTTQPTSAKATQPKAAPCASGHNWAAATCSAPKTCSVCKKTEGSALGHKWTAASCTVAKKCSACGATDGQVLGHNWISVTCTAPKTCSVCKATEGTASGHTWQAATCSEPKKCSVCNTTEGNALEHQWKAATSSAPKTCTQCGTTTGEPVAAKVDPVSKEGFREDFANCLRTFDTTVTKISVTEMYKDGERIKSSCEKAVQLMFDLGIMRGNEHGEFGPDYSLTRAELAKIIYLLHNGGKADGATDYTNWRLFDDVSSDEWYAGYCNYFGTALMKAEQGRNNGSFRPLDPVTTAEAAKALLCAMGYSSESCGYTGSSWWENVTAAANKVGLFEGFEAEAINQSLITQQWFAVMIHNALNYV